MNTTYSDWSAPTLSVSVWPDGSFSNCPGSTYYCWQIYDNDIMTQIPQSTAGYNSVTATYSLRGSGLVGNRDCLIQYTTNNGQSYQDLYRMGDNGAVIDQLFNGWDTAADDNSVGVGLRLSALGSAGQQCYFNEFSIEGIPIIVPTTGTATLSPSNHPTTVNPTKNPSVYPTTPSPSNHPATVNPTQYPSVYPTTTSPSNPTQYPSIYPTTSSPSNHPTTTSPSNPTQYPSIYPTTTSPSNHPTSSPMSTIAPSSNPAYTSTVHPSATPTYYPSTSTITISPTNNPSSNPTTNKPTTMLSTTSTLTTIKPTTLKPTTNIPTMLSPSTRKPTNNPILTATPTNIPTTISPTSYPTFNIKIEPSTSSNSTSTSMVSIKQTVKKNVSDSNIWEQILNIFIIFLIIIILSLLIYCIKTYHRRKRKKLINDTIQRQRNIEQTTDITKQSTVTSQQTMESIHDASMSDINLVRYIQKQAINDDIMSGTNMKQRLNTLSDVYNEYNMEGVHVYNTRNQSIIEGNIIAMNDDNAEEDYIRKSIKTPRQYDDDETGDV